MGEAGPAKAGPNIRTELAWNSGENALNPCQFAVLRNLGGPDPKKARHKHPKLGRASHAWSPSATSAEEMTQMGEAGPAKAGPNITAHALPTASARSEKVTQMGEAGPAKAGPNITALGQASGRLRQPECLCGPRSLPIGLGQLGARRSSGSEGWRSRGR